MKIIYGIGNIKKSFAGGILAMGVFDGVHRGHQRLIQKAVKRSRVVKTQSFVITFFPHPVRILQPQSYLPLIVSLPHRLKLVEDLGVDVCVVIHFTKGFSRLDPEEFIRRYLVHYFRPKEIFVGDDFHFGQNRQGTLDYFRQEGQRYGFKVKAVPAVQSDHRKISSSQIRQLIAEGQLKKAKQLLGRNISVMGKVRKGDARGQRLGFPTANISPRDEVVLPLGVYAVRVEFDGKIFYGMANVGRRPSFKKKETGLSVEVHIFDFRKKIYRREMIVEFIQKIREEKIFDSEENLIQQLKKDEVKIRSILALGS